MNRLPRLIAPLIAVLVTPMLMQGCASSLTLPETRPADYTMLVTVYPAPGERTPGESAFRAARYAVGPDGLLRAESGDGVTDPGFPPIARRLEPAQLDEIYTLARDTNPTRGNPVPGTLVYSAPKGFRVAVLEITSLGTTKAYEFDAADDSPAAPLIRELARLSWLDR